LRLMPLSSLLIHTGVSEMSQLTYDLWQKKLGKYDLYLMMSLPKQHQQMQRGYLIGE